MDQEPITDFRVGSILGRSFSVLIKNIVPFGLLAIILFLPNTLFNIYVTNGGPAANSLFSIAGAIGSIIGTLLSYLLTAALVYGTFKSLKNEPAGMGDILSKGLSTMLPVFGVALITGIAVGIGFFLLIIPGIVLLTMLYVVVPVAVIERPGVFASISRSIELTKGFRLRILGLVVLLYILIFVPAAMLGFVFSDEFLAGNISPGYLIASLIPSALITALSSVVVTIAYHDLRAVKEGADVTQLAAVFD